MNDRPPVPSPVPSPSASPGDSARVVGDLVDLAARLRPDAPSLGFRGSWETFAETRRRTDETARALLAVGVRPGDKVSLWMTNRPEWIHVLYALAKIGAVMVPINTRFRPDDLRYVLAQSDSAGLIAMERSGPIDYMEMILEVCPELARGGPDEFRPHAFPELKWVAAVGESLPPGARGWADFLRGGDAVDPAEVERRAAAVSPDDPLFVMYTSGTTGFPKGAVHTHAVLRNVRSTAARMEMSPDDCTVMFLPLFHAFGYYEGALLCPATASRMVLTETFDPGEVLATIESERGTLIHGFDTHWQDLMDHPDFARRDLSSVRTGILAAGLPSTEKIAERAFREFRPTVTGYGMTEIMPGALLGRVGDDVEKSARTSGRPQEGYEFKVADERTGAPLPPGTPGELRVRGYAVMREYYRKPDETAASFDADGWFRTGDMGVELPDGSFRCLGRYKEMLKVGGENVDPIEVEAYYLTHPAVARIQIVGVADRRLSEVPVAFVNLAPGMVADETELHGFAKGRIASYKIPKHFFFVDEYPMTPSGKVKRFELRAIARRELGINEETPEGR